jgi:adenine-specific DNA-methyltransferase
MRFVGLEMQTSPIIDDVASKSVLELVDLHRIRVGISLDPERKTRLGQFLTPSPVAKFMASLFQQKEYGNIRLLDAGAGIGSLIAAFTEEFCGRTFKSCSIEVTAYELESILFDELNLTVAECRKSASAAGINFGAEILKEDFVKAAGSMLSSSLLEKTAKKSFTHVIMNPPYKKIRSDSEYRSIFEKIGIETGNLYAGFMSIAVKLLEPNGELVAIVPRSFCNGPYFRHFRKVFFDTVTLKKIHIFESREEAFRDDEVLQENVILHAIKGCRRGQVTITGSHGADFENITLRNVNYEDVVRDESGDCIVHIAANDIDDYAIDRLKSLPYSLDEIGIEASTGRVVDFRCEENIKWEKENRCVPLLYPAHFSSGFLEWPKDTIKKPNYFVMTEEMGKLLMPGDGYYTVVKRFSPKEEVRRIVSAIYDPTRIIAEYVAFENHLNVMHANGGGLSEKLSKGLAVFLSSTLVDIYFRHFSGHTQVNAADLQMLRYPSRETLERIGSYVGDSFPNQKGIDDLIEKELHTMSNLSKPNPVKAKIKKEEALLILKTLGFPRAQLNDRSALTLLALINMTPTKAWPKAEQPLMGITPIMTFCHEHYGVAYAPNTRETFRRQTIHQFVDAGLAMANPDDPERPVNSPKCCYQIEPSAFELLKMYGTRKWDTNLREYLSRKGTLAKKYARDREMTKIPVQLPDGMHVELTPGSHNELLRSVVMEFCPRFTPGGKVIYIGDTGGKWKHADFNVFEELGVEVDSHGKMPDLMIYYTEKQWVVVVEVVTSHGPVDAKRRGELSKLFEEMKDKLVYVTAFPTKSLMARYLSEISWETEVWVAENPDHLVHFNGKRFLGPYQE